MKCSELNAGDVVAFEIPRITDKKCYCQQGVVKCVKPKRRLVLVTYQVDEGDQIVTWPRFASFSQMIAKADESGAACRIGMQNNFEGGFEGKYVPIEEYTGDIPICEVTTAS